MTVPQPNRLYKCHFCDTVTASVAPPEICNMCEVIDRVLIKLIHRTPTRVPQFHEIKVISTPMREG